MGRAPRFGLGIVNVFNSEYQTLATTLEFFLVSLRYSRRVTVLVQGVPQRI